MLNANGLKVWKFWGRNSRLFGGGHGVWLFGWLFCMNRKDVCVD